MQKRELNLKPTQMTRFGIGLHPFAASLYPMSNPTPLTIGTRREPFFDGHLIEKLTRVSHELIDPNPTSVVIPFD